MELEIKLAATAPITEADVLDAVGALGEIGGVTRRRLWARYHDRADGFLRLAGWTLRCRDEGGPIVATVKGPGPIVAGVRSRSEDEVEVDVLAQPGDPLPDAVAEPLGRAGLPLATWPEVRFETDMQRCAILVDLGDAVAEIAFDRGEVRAGDASVPVVEVEVELKSGAPEAIAPFAAALAARLPVRPAARSKAAWGGFLTGVLRAYAAPPDDASPALLWEAWCELQDRLRDPDGAALEAERDRVAALLGITDDPWTPLARLTEGP